MLHGWLVSQGWEQPLGVDVCHQLLEDSVNIKQPQACQTGFQARAAWRPVITSNQAALPVMTVPSLVLVGPGQGLEQTELCSNAEPAPASRQGSPWADHIDS